MLAELPICSPDCRETLMFEHDWACAPQNARWIVHVTYTSSCCLDAKKIDGLVLLHDAIISSLVFRPYRLRSSQLFLSESMCTRVSEISRGQYSCF